MKPLRVFFLVLILSVIPAFFSRGSLCAMDSVFFMLGSEVNGNSREKYPAAYEAAFGLTIGETVSFGAKLGFHGDFDTATIWESRFFFRYWLNPSRLRFFIQAEAGLVNRQVEEDKQTMLSLGMLSGASLSMGSVFSLEPAVRIGYPFLWGAGLSAVFRIQGSSGGKPPEPPAAE